MGGPQVSIRDQAYIDRVETRFRGRSLDFGYALRHRCNSMAGVSSDFMLLVKRMRIDKFGEVYWNIIRLWKLLFVAAQLSQQHLQPLRGKFKAIALVAAGIAWLDQALAAPAGAWRARFSVAPYSTALSYLYEPFLKFDWDTWAIHMDVNANFHIVPRSACKYWREFEKVWILNDYQKGNFASRVREHWLDNCKK